MYELNSTVKSIVQQVTVGINAEVNALRDEANNRIGAREIARDLINETLNDWPVLVKGNHMVSYKDDRGEDQVKLQAKNLSLWVVALQTTLEQGHTSYHLLGSTFAAWAKDALAGLVWEPASARKTARIFIKVMQRNGLLNKKAEEMEYVNDDGVTMTAKVVYLTDKCKDTMHNVSMQMRENTSMICKPLRNQPMDWVDSDTGVGDNAGLRLITNSHLMHSQVSPAVLAAVNKLQAVEFVVSPHIIDAAYDLLDNQHEYKSTVEEIRMYREVIAYEKGSYYFPVTMDTRGRMYYRGGILTPQGTDFAKAAFQFAEFLPLGDNGFEAICLQVATCLGYDKLSIDERLYKVQQHIDCGDFEHDIDMDFMKKHFPDASSVFQGIVAINELQRVLSKHVTFGTPIQDIFSNLVCHQDGTCNGLQHMAAITHNRQTAETVNCVASTTADVPSDIYGIVASAAAMLSASTPSVSDLIIKYGRDMAKNPVMITGYGAGTDTVIANTAAYLIKKGAIQANQTALAVSIGEAYIKAMDQVAGAVKALTEAIKARVKSRVENGQTKFTWITYDGFIACTEYRDDEVNRVRAGKFNALVRNMFPAPLDEVKTIGAMAPNFIHSIDGTHCRLVIKDCNHSLVTVHDSIGSHPCNYHKTSQSIREQFFVVHSYDAIGNLCDEMGVRSPKFRGDYNANEALNAQYIFN